MSSDAADDTENRGLLRVRLPRARGLVKPAGRCCPCRCASLRLLGPGGPVPAEKTLHGGGGGGGGWGGWGGQAGGCCEGCDCSEGGEVKMASRVDGWVVGGVKCGGGGDGVKCGGGWVVR